MTEQQALSVLIVDDEAPARARLRDLLSDIAPEVPNAIVGEASDGMQALSMVENNTVDVALVDIRMPGMDGVELARHCAQLYRPPSIVFVTAFDSYAVEAFELNAIDYLVKPVRAQRLAAALIKAKAHHALGPQVLAQVQQTARTHLSCHDRGRLLLIPLPEILYLKADLKYVTARTVEREYLLDESLTRLEDEFAERFIRLHRSVLVARNAIAGFEKSTTDDSETLWQALLRDIPDRLPVSRRQWPVVKSLAKSATR